MAQKKSLPVIKPFDPLDKHVLGDTVAGAAINSPVYPLPPKPFIGAGVYMLYYTGDFPAYKLLSEQNQTGNFNYPIYVGKAVPAGARKGGQGFEVEHGTALHKRLSEHSESIKAAENLQLSDFHCRFLVLEDIWIPLAESLLIEKFQPVWNLVLEGFGNHNPGSGRHNGQMPLWDQLHPGRTWAKSMKNCSIAPCTLEQRIENYLSKQFVK